MTRIAAALIAIIVGIGAAAAQETRIAAVVNEDMISLGDLEARIRLVLLSSQLPDNEQVRQRVAPQVLRTLIDEKLEMQEAKKFNVSASEDDANKAFDRLEQQNNMPKGGLEKVHVRVGSLRQARIAILPEAAERMGMRLLKPSAQGERAATPAGCFAECAMPTRARQQREMAKSRRHIASRTTPVMMSAAAQTTSRLNHAFASCSAGAFIAMPGDG